MVEYEEVYFTRSAYNPYEDFPRHDKVVDVILSLYRPRSFLDIGCAYGFIVKRFQQLDIPAVGLDVSAWCGIKSKDVIPGCYIRGTADCLPFKDKAFDLCFSEGTLEHIAEDLIPKVFAEMERVSNVRIIGVSPNSPQIDGHICNHDIDWWVARIPDGTYIGSTGVSVDIERNWIYKNRGEKCLICV